MDTSDNQSSQLPATGAPAAVPQPATSAASSSSQASGPHTTTATPAGHPDFMHAQSVGEALAELASLVPGFAGYKAAEDRRIADKATLVSEVAEWETARNAAGSRIDWRFTTADARIKLKRLYPVQA